MTRVPAKAAAESEGIQSRDEIGICSQIDRPQLDRVKTRYRRRSNGRLSVAPMLMRQARKGSPDEGTRRMRRRALHVPLGCEGS